MGCFVAILDTDGAPVEHRLLRSMMEVPPFSASRDLRLWIDGYIGLGHVPLHSSDVGLAHTDRLHVVMDGRLDDRAALVRQLEGSSSSRLTSVPDAALVLAAYEAWGTSCVEHLLGDFSLCVWDAPRRQLFCARDHLGVKPLYYARVGTALVVSNVLRSIRRHPGISDRLDDSAICDLLLVGACLDPSRTSFAGVARVPPAHILTVSAGDSPPRINRFWSLQPGDELRLRDPREYLERYTGVLETVVRDRLPNAPVGVLMSGGLDSSSVAAAAAHVLGPDLSPTALRAYTLVYDGIADDEERRYSSVVARRLGIAIEHLPVDGYGWFERWDQGLLPPEPSTEPMTAMTADLLERVSRHGAVALTGDGGDPALLPSTLVSQLGRTSPARLVSDAWRSAWRTRTLPPIGVRSMARQWVLRRTPVPVWLSAAFVRRCDPEARMQEIGRQRAPAEGPRGAAIRSILDPWWTSMFETYDPGAAMRPVELRYPLFDVRFLSFAVRLPTHPWCVNKEIVRAAMRGRLPEEICGRPKSPLAVDIQSVHGRWTVADVVRAIEAVPELESYIDARVFRTRVREDRLLTDEEPGTWAAVALATWLRCALSESAPA